MTGFQVTLIGRFWVTPEGRDARVRTGTYPAAVRVELRYRLCLPAKSLRHHIGSIDRASSARFHCHQHKYPFLGMRRILFKVHTLEAGSRTLRGMRSIDEMGIDLLERFQELLGCKEQMPSSISPGRVGVSEKAELENPGH
jgi:hypothetical protein